MPGRSYRPLLFALAVAGLLLDQATKYGVFAWLADHKGQLERPQLSPHTFVVFRTSDDLDERGSVRGFTLVAARDHTGDGLALHVNRGALFGWLGQLGTSANNLF